MLLIFLILSHCSRKQSRKNEKLYCTFFDLLIFLYRTTFFSVVHVLSQLLACILATRVYITELLFEPHITMIDIMLLSMY